MASSESSREDARRRKEELELVKDFWTVVQQRLQDIQQRELSVVGSGGTGKFELEEEERKILYKVSNVGLVPGVAAGLATLFMLRGIRPNMLRRLSQRQPPPQNSSPHVTNSPFQQQGAGGGDKYKQMQPNVVLRVFGWTLDLMSSFFVAAGASIVL